LATATKLAMSVARRFCTRKAKGRVESSETAAKSSGL
jgi:hypothetical protein